MNQITILALAGPSGAGKTELISQLLEMYPDYTTMWRQSTSRPRRDSSDNYVFLTPAQYAHVEPLLTCRTEFNGNLYGTFPEPISGEVAVLTIADANGLADLERDVLDHNCNIAAGEGGKLGAHRVKLVKVLVKYDVNFSSVASRGRGSRGVEFIGRELENLNAFTYDVVLNTTQGWPEPAHFFDNIVWPAISERDDSSAEPMRARVRDICETIVEMSDTFTDGDVLRTVIAMAEKVVDVLAEGSRRESDDIEDDDIDAVLDAIVEDEQPSSIDDRESDHAELAGAINTTDAIDEPVQNHDDAPVPAFDDEPIDETLDAPEAITETMVYASTVLSPKDVFAIDITDWMMDEAIDIGAFESETDFLIMFAQYVSANGGDPNDITISSQATQDDKGGKVTEFVAHMPTGERYGLEFNDRIKRAMNYGLRA